MRVLRQSYRHSSLRADLARQLRHQRFHRFAGEVQGEINPSLLTSDDKWILLKLHEAIHIEALPADIPGEIEVDISPMTMERPITIADLPKVKGVSYVDDPEEVLFNLQLTREEVAEEAAATDVEPEVVKKGKQTDEDED